MTTPAVRRVPYRIVTDRLVLRGIQPADAARVKAAVDASRAHARPFAAWALQAPLSLEQTMQRLRRSRAKFDRDEGYEYLGLSGDETEVVGEAGLDPMNRYGDLDVGYWVAAGHLRRGYAVEMAGALTRVAIEVFGLERVELRTSTANEASRRVAVKLGYREEAVLARRIPTEDGGRDDVVVYTMFANDHPKSAAALVSCRCFDAMGEAIPLRGA